MDIKRKVREFIDSQKTPSYLDGVFKNTILGIPPSLWFTDITSIKDVDTSNPEYKKLCIDANVAPTAYYASTMHSYVIACAEHFISNHFNLLFFRRRLVIFIIALLSSIACLFIAYGKVTHATTELKEKAQQTLSVAMTPQVGGLQ